MNRSQLEAAILEMEDSRLHSEQALEQFHLKWEAGLWETDDENAYFLAEEWIGIASNYLAEYQLELKKFAGKAA
jgi:hypothetical protein